MRRIVDPHSQIVILQINLDRGTIHDIASDQGAANTGFQLML